MSSNASIVSKHIDICFLNGVNSFRQVFIFSSAKMFWCSLLRHPAPVRQKGLSGWGVVGLGLVMREERGREPEQRFFIFWLPYKSLEPKQYLEQMSSRYWSHLAYMFLPCVEPITELNLFFEMYMYLWWLTAVKNATVGCELDDPFPLWDSPTVYRQSL